MPEKLTLLILIFVANITCQAGTAGNRDTIDVSTTPEVEYQVIDGFGASDAWRAQFVGENWPVEKREYIADLLFSQEIDKDGNPNFQEEATQIRILKKKIYNQKKEYTPTKGDIIRGIAKEFIEET